MQEKPRTTYWDYIRVEDLLRLQGGLNRDEGVLTDDEVVFIAVHQVYELWFKLALRDLEAARDLFAAPAVPETALGDACRRLERLREIFALCARHFDLVETITTRDYLEFRDRLFPANGGQSAQFRELEILLGLDDENERIPYVSGGSFEEVLRDPSGAESPALARVRRRLADRPTFREALYEWLYRTPIDGSVPADAGDQAAVSGFVEDYLERHRRYVEGLADRVCRAAASEREREEIRRRYAGEIEQARSFLTAADRPEEERAKRRRIRAAALFIELHRDLPLLSQPRRVLDLVVAVEQALLVYRQRHARMAERVIGRRVGTGGSSGVEYLDRAALAYRVFPDLWQVRTILLRRDLVRDPLHPDLYDFRFEPPGGA